MDPTDLHLTRHAVERYCERVKPGLGPLAARRELWALIQLADEPAEQPPAWCDTYGPGRRYAEICAGIVLVLSFRQEQWWIETVLVSAGMSERRRELRNRKASSKRARRHKRRLKLNDRKQRNRDKRLGRRPDSERDAA